MARTDGATGADQAGARPASMRPVGRYGWLVPALVTGASLLVVVLLVVVP